VELGGYGPQAINYNESNTHIGQLMLEHSDIGVEATDSPTHANDRKVFCNTLTFH
jgi:hypothetical protein